MPLRIKLIFNPFANLGRAWPIGAALRPIVNELGPADWTGTVYPTHATELARQAGEDGYDLVVAMGGDGTVHEVVNGLMQIPAGRRPSLGVVPLGSGNDFAFSAGIPQDPEAALRQVYSGKPCPVDVGSVDDLDGRQEYWVNAVGLGFDTAVTIHSRRIPVIQGFALYFAAVLKTILTNFDVYNVHVTADGVSFDEKVLLLVFCNGGREGGGFQVAPHAKVDDGVLHYVGVRKISRAHLLATLPSFMNGKHAALKHVLHGDFNNIAIQSEQPLLIHTDGEIFAGYNGHTRRLSLKIHPGALRIIRPETHA